MDKAEANTRKGKRITTTAAASEALGGSQGDILEVWRDPEADEHRSQESTARRDRRRTVCIAGGKQADRRSGSDPRAEVSHSEAGRTAGPGAQEQLTVCIIVIIHSHGQTSRRKEVAPTTITSPLRQEKVR